jgi:hypothetical protein
MDVCGGCGYDCGGGYDGLGICNGTCNDSSACGEDSSGCLFIGCDGGCNSSVANPPCCPTAEQVLLGLVFVCGGNSITGTLAPSSTPRVRIAGLLGLPSILPL